MRYHIGEVWMDYDKIKRLIDKQDILEILYKYCEAADKNDPENMVKFFDNNCVVQYVHTESIKRGSQELSDHLFSFLGAVISGSHYIMNPLLQFLLAEILHVTIRAIAKPLYLKHCFDAYGPVKAHNVVASFFAGERTQQCRNPATQF